MPNPTGKGGFRKGRSGNPSGRPKKDERLRRIEDMAKEHSEEALKALLDEARNGKGAPRVAAACALLDRAWGKPIERSRNNEHDEYADLKDKSTEELEEEARQLLAQGVKLGYIKVLRRKQRDE